jgi:hypothetical protein
MVRYRLITLILIAAGLLAACAPGGSPATPTTTGGGVPATLPPAARAVQEDVAKRLYLQPGQIIVTALTEQQFPDSCLGVHLPDEACSQVVTPGYVITVEGGGNTYVYHTNKDGSSLVFYTFSGSNAKGSMLTWHREGGVAGYCDDLIVDADGLAHVLSCKGGQTKELKTYQLSSNELGQLEKWIAQFKGFAVHSGDPAVTDAIQTTTVLNGQGTTETSPIVQQSITVFATGLFGVASRQ